MSEPPLIRQARDDDAAATARLIYLTSPAGYRLFGGNERRAFALIEAAFARPDTDCAREVTTIAELGGEVAGALAAFPAAEGEERRRRFLRVALRRRAPWHWPHMLFVARHGVRHSPMPPADSFYIDSLATAERFRRRGVAAALMAAAEHAARECRSPSLALDTLATNSGARALYEGLGFEVDEELPAAPPIPALVGYVKKLA